MTLTPAQAREIRRWQARQERARVEYDTHPISTNDRYAWCKTPTCRARAGADGLCADCTQARREKQKQEKGSA